MNKKKAGIISAVAVLIAVAIVVMTVTDKGSGLQAEKIPVNMVKIGVNGTIDAQTQSGQITGQTIPIKGIL